MHPLIRALSHSRNPAERQRGRYLARYPAQLRAPGGLLRELERAAKNAAQLSKDAGGMNGGAGASGGPIGGVSVSTDSFVNTFNEQNKRKNRRGKPSPI